MMHGDFDGVCGDDDASLTLLTDSWMVSILIDILMIYVQ
jgi:hypothetical protein